MHSGNKRGHKTTLLLCSFLAGAGFLGAATDDSTTTAPQSTAVPAPQSQSDEILKLKAALADQQKQLQALQQSMKTQQELLDKALAVQPPNANSAGGFDTAGQVASTVPIVPAIRRPVPGIPAALTAAYPAPSPAAYPLPQGNSSSAATGNPCDAKTPAAGSTVPAYIRMGSVCVVPVGFMDFTTFWRDKAAATGTLGSNFGSVPYNNGANGNLSEYHFSVQNSRLGFRLDGDWKGTHFIGYNEDDFNGTGGSTNYAVTNGAIVPRIRLFWIDVRKGPIEFLAGQSWSMLTPNRKGLSALPGDLFYSQVIDINYIAGLTWTRQPGLRVLLHSPGDKVNFGFSIEQGDPYGGGSGGGGAITLPAALAALVPQQVDQGSNISVSGSGYLNQATFMPDFIAKLAFDPTSRFHFELGGILSADHIVFPAAPWVHHKDTRGGVTFGLNAAVTKSVRFVASGMLSDGEGRYLFGAGPDFIVRANGDLSPVHADSWISGVEATVKNTLLYAYYSGDYIGRNVAIDTNGSLIGYGFKGAANSNNRAIQEATFGFNQTMWKDARYGAINLMGQYEYLLRAPWYWAAGVGGGKQTHDNTIYFNLRYTLPGSMPNF